MSFYTSFFYYRPDTPPLMTGADLSGFVSEFAALGLASGEGSIGYRVKFGRSIDQDEQPSAWDEPIMPGGVISVPCEIEYDAEGSDLPDLARLAGDLAPLDRPIYRATIDLGGVADAVYSRTERGPSEENDISLSLDSWNLRVGPIMSHSLGVVDTYMVGWIAIAMHGYGYLFPWSFRDLIDRAESAPGIRDLMSLCRRTWPVEPTKPRRNVVKARKTMGELWPYPDARLPWDWYWGLAESG
jgi:hypothetical protein